jgi:hypothetical protein
MDGMLWVLLAIVVFRAIAFVCDSLQSRRSGRNRNGEGSDSWWGGIADTWGGGSDSGGSSDCGWGGSDSGGGGGGGDSGGSCSS